MLPLQNDIGHILNPQADKLKGELIFLHQGAPRT